MQSADLKPTDGAAAGSWIASGLGGAFGAVTLVVPTGFEAYARIFHPAFDQQSKRVPWGDVATVCGTTPHREMQWHAILGLRDADDLRGSYSPNDESGVKWAGSDPSIGAMDIETLDALCKVLADYTADAARCFFGLCTIQSWLDAFSADELQPLLELPYDRDYIVLAGPLSAVDQIANRRTKLNSMRLTSAAKDEKGPPLETEPPVPLHREAPNLIWPQDRAWLVASEVDFDSTLVGGSAELIETIIETPGIESWQVAPSSSLAADADKINVKENTNR